MVGEGQFASCGDDHGAERVTSDRVEIAERLKLVVGNCGRSCGA